MFAQGLVLLVFGLAPLVFPDRPEQLWVGLGCLGCFAVPLTASGVALIYRSVRGQRQARVRKDQLVLRPLVEAIPASSPLHHLLRFDLTRVTSWGWFLFTAAYAWIVVGLVLSFEPIPGNEPGPQLAERTTRQFRAVLDGILLLQISMIILWALRIRIVRLDEPFDPNASDRPT
jgi:hypothetical protein